MIDYLERIFSTKTEHQPESLAFDGTKTPEKSASDEPGVAATPNMTQLQEEPVSTEVPDRGETFWQQEALRRVERALAVESGEPYSVKISRPGENRAEEGLEDRLRRRSRRYDGGFYLY